MNEAPHPGMAEQGAACAEVGKQVCVCVKEAPRSRLTAALPAYCHKAHIACCLAFLFIAYLFPFPPPRLYPPYLHHASRQAPALQALLHTSLPTFPTPSTGTCPPGQPTSLIVLDDAHWLSRSPALLRPLLQSREQGGASVAFLLIGQQAWGSGEGGGRSCREGVREQG